MYRECADWERTYGHPIYFLETFIDPERFHGTCYRAANWVVLEVPHQAQLLDKQVACFLARLACLVDVAVVPAVVVLPRV